VTSDLQSSADGRRVPDEQCGHLIIKLTKQKRSSSRHALCRVWRSVPRPYKLRADSRCLKIAVDEGVPRHSQRVFEGPRRCENVRERTFEKLLLLPFSHHRARVSVVPSV
jgi:hypothetical protein